MAVETTQWPGEWHPARNDVSLASEAPDPALISDFKKQLLATEDTRGMQNIMHMDLSKKRSDNEYTYPVALLSQLPPIPEHFELLRLWQEFLRQRLELPFISSVPISSSPRENVAPHLLLAAASFAFVCERDVDRASDAFVAGINLWSAMLEIDNREARTEETLVTGMLLSLYGPLEADVGVWRWARLILYGVTTIARRRRLHDYRLLEDTTSLEAHRYTVAALWLADLLQAIHMDAPMNFCTEEINMDMIQSLHTVQDLRASLIHGQPLPIDVQDREDALLLLLALQTDAVYLQRSVGKLSSTPDPINPFVPFSPHSEYQRMSALLSSALDTWHQSFTSVDTDILVLYHYSRLYLKFPQVTSLATSIGYPESIKTTKLMIEMPGDAVKFAWKILDTAAEIIPGQNTQIWSPWLPVIVFHAALVIWADIANCGSVYAPSKRVLTPFILELRKMNWPCCTKMAATLEALMMDPSK